MELSKRLQAVADLVTPGLVVADIGTDHGYIPLYLLNSGKNPQAIAMDVRKGPLARAEEHLSALLEHGKVQIRLSDGMKELKPGEADSVVMAGMGGSLMIRILQEGREVTAQLRECILQPQSEIVKVRAFLLQEGFSVIQEDMVEEDGKYYPMMKVIPRTAVAGDSKCQEEWTEEELHYGKRLLEKQHPVLKSFLLREEKIRRGILAELSKLPGDRAEKRIYELEQELCLIQKALARYKKETNGCGAEKL